MIYVLFATVNFMHPHLKYLNKFKTHGIITVCGKSCGILSSSSHQLIPATPMFQHFKLSCMWCEINSLPTKLYPFKPIGGSREGLLRLHPKPFEF